MIRSVTVFEIECDGCGEGICPPRAQDYWDSVDDAQHNAEWSESWAFAPDRQLCWRCVETSAPSGMVGR